MDRYSTTRMPVWSGQNIARNGIMNAEEYITKHWVPNKIWTHLEWPKHQKRLRRCAGLVEGETFADVGCACGHSTNIMAKFRVGSWCGIDFSETAVEMARKLFPDLIFSTQLEEGTVFDSVVCSEVIEHVEDDKALVEQLLAVTRKRLVLTTPSMEVNDPGHLRLYTVPMLHEFATECKCRIVDEDGYYYTTIIKGEEQ